MIRASAPSCRTSNPVEENWDLDFTFTRVKMNMNLNNDAPFLNQQNGIKMTDRKAKFLNRLTTRDFHS